MHRWNRTALIQCNTTTGESKERLRNKPAEAIIVTTCDMPKAIDRISGRVGENRPLDFPAFPVLSVSQLDFLTPKTATFNFVSPRFEESDGFMDCKNTTPGQLRTWHFTPLDSLTNIGLRGSCKVVNGKCGAWLGYFLIALVPKAFSFFWLRLIL